MDKWTWRDRVASRIHWLAYKFGPGVANDISIRDEAGIEVFRIAFEGGFVATGPVEPYTAHSRDYAGDDDLEGTVTDW